MSCNLWKLEDGVFYPLGQWTVDGLSGCFPSYDKLPVVRSVDLSEVVALDTFGALLVIHVMEKNGLSIKDVRGKAQHLSLLKFVLNHRDRCPVRKGKSFVDLLSDSVHRWFAGILSFFDFLGRVTLSLKMIGDFEVRLFFRDLQETGIKALPIIAVLSFLIGIVIAYQSSAQLARFGANIFVVDLVVLSMVRELAPLIVAVLISGRSASSYTATIGTMKVNEELDALEVMGMSPIASVALPRMLSLLVVTPFLVVFADLVGIFGGMLVSKFALGVEFPQFVRRMGMVLKPHHFWSGIAKAPLFGLFVAFVGTWKGFVVEKRAESVGAEVIKSVVISIFGVIVIDAVFSVIFRWLGI